MRLIWAEARDFRNHRLTRVEVPPGLTVVVGPNGQGKTNLLEALFYLLALESPRVRSDQPLVRIGAGSAFLRGEVETPGGRLLVEVEVRPSGQNRVKVNRSPVRRRRDLRRQVRAVFSGPDDLSVVVGEPEHRRRFMDESVRGLWPLQEGLPAAYERVLRQRNRLLREWEGSGPPKGLEAWDAELASAGGRLGEARAAAVAVTATAAAREFAMLSGQGRESLVCEYRPSAWGESPAEALRQALTARRAEELARRTTVVGPHRDDLHLAVEGMVARGFASHGEAWGAALSLRLGLGAAVAAEAGDPPVTFLDDPFSALDPARRARVAGSLAGRGQVLVAVPDDLQIPEDGHVWRVRDGGVADG